MRGWHLATFDSRAAEKRHVTKRLDGESRRPLWPWGRLQGKDKLGIALRECILCWEAADVRIEEHLVVEAYIAVAAELGVVLHDERAWVGHVAEQSRGIGRKRHFRADGC